MGFIKGEIMEINKRLKLLIEFINKNGPEIHYEKENEDKMIIFIYPFWMNDFVKIFDVADDEHGFDFKLIHSNIVFILDDFLEDYCEISLDDFAIIANINP